MFVVFIEGFGLAISLCAAVGAQSLFIIERGMAKNYVFLICALCFMCDIVLMSMGVFGVGAYFAKNLYLSLFLNLFGAIFTGFYAFLALKTLFQTFKKKQVQTPKKLSLKKTLLFTLGVTLLNPQVYLEMVFLIGASALSFDLVQKFVFLAGTLSAALSWLLLLCTLSLRYGSKLLNNQKIFMGVNLFVTAIMGTLSVTLFRDFLALLSKT
ncbi:LysE family transporter [Helicobacter pylori]